MFLKLARQTNGLNNAKIQIGIKIIIYLDKAVKIRFPYNRDLQIDGHLKL